MTNLTVALRNFASDPQKKEGKEEEGRKGRRKKEKGN